MNTPHGDPWRSLPALLQQRAEQCPTAIAIEYTERGVPRELSYQALLDESARLAERIQQRATPGSVVALAFPKSPELVCAWLGCWLAGVAFSTLDPSLPARRAAHILQRLRPALVLHAPMSSQVTALTTAPSQAFELSDAETSTSVFPQVSIDPGDLAYVCWTSGSTGAPKGALIEHRGLPHVLSAQVEAFQLSAGSRCLWLLRPAFDASLSDVFSCLLAGGALHIATDSATASARALLNTLRRAAISHVDMPPSLLRVLPLAELPEQVRSVVIGGEVPDLESVRKWSSRLRLINVYGPTECTICTSMQLCDPQLRKAWLGSPIPGTRYAILPRDADATSDSAERDREPGAARASSRGELLIAGPQLGRGYWEQPQLSQERFLELSLDGGPRERWYRTGDLVERHGADLAFVGRIDRQLKLNGQLIAPEDVEAALVATGLVTRAQVSLEGKRLVARVEGAAGAQPEDELRRALAALLPTWMLPHGYIFSDQLPTTISGKLMPAGGARADEHAAAEPEPLLLQLVRNQLGQVDAARSFFAQGGDSLGALELLVSCEARGLTLTPEALAGPRTLGELCAATPELCQAAPAADFTSAGHLDRDVERLAETLGLAETGPRPACHAATDSDRDDGCLLLTGATGFLGSRTLLELLERDPALRVALLVRARDPLHAEARLSMACDAHVPGALAAQRERLTIIPGDLTQPELGCTAADYQLLLRHTKQLVHCAAAVHLVSPYAALRTANLLGTQQILQFCQRARVVTLHYASTLSVFSSTDRCPAECFETARLDRSARVSGGYAQSKWAAERLLERAEGQIATRLRIYRFGLITGDSQSGYAPASDWLGSVSRSFAALGVAPADPRLHFDVTPVDYAARAWAGLICQHDAAGQSLQRFHVAGARVSLQRWLNALRGAGASIIELAPKALQRHLDALTDANKSAADRRHQAALSLGSTRSLAESSLDTRRGLDLFQATGVRFDCSRSLGRLSGLGVEHPGASPRLLNLYAAHLLKEPQGDA